jgi:hypothetical protein
MSENFEGDLIWDFGVSAPILGCFGGLTDF